MEKTDEAVFTHFLAAEYSRQCEAIDNAVLAEVVKDSLSREFDVYTWAMERVANSAVLSQLLADKLTLLSQTNSSRISNRFGR
jgi:hypothetical protein